MTRTSLKAFCMAVLVGLAALSLPATAEAGRGWGGHGWNGGHGYYGGRGYYGRGLGGGGYWGAGLIGLAAGAAIGAAIAPPPVIVEPDYLPPPGPAAYAPAAYGPPAWSPEWYTYCAQRYRSFSARTGYFTGYDGLPHFCQ